MAGCLSVLPWISWSVFCLPCFPASIYLYESMPYNIELMNRPLEDYLQKKQKIRITGGVFRGKEGCIMRLHRNTRLVFAFGNMTVAVSYLHAFPFEKIE